MKLFRPHRHWSLLPAILWLAAQLAMATGSGAAARTAPGPTGDTTPLIAGLAPELWLCGPGSDAAPDHHDPAAAFAGHCDWCQAFGAMPEPAAVPSALPPFRVAALANQPFTEPAATAFALPITGFRSRAPPL